MDNSNNCWHIFILGSGINYILHQQVSLWDIYSDMPLIFTIVFAFLSVLVYWQFLGSLLVIHMVLILFCRGCNILVSLPYLNRICNDVGCAKPNSIGHIYNIWSADDSAKQVVLHDFAGDQLCLNCCIHICVSGI